MLTNKYLLPLEQVMIRIDWEYPEVPEYDPDIHDPEKVFAFMCYRGVHYAKWVYLNIFIEGSSWNLNNPRKDDTRTNT